MGKVHPFYRFGQAWNAGFFPDNQIMSDLLNEIQTDIGTWLPGYFPGTTIDQLYKGIRDFVNQYTQSPYYGSFVFTIQKIPDSPNYEYNITIRNYDLSVNDPSQVITINGFFNNITQLVLNANVAAFSPGSYSGTFEPTLIQEELKVEEALNVVNLNGGAIFPITYSFNPTNNIATSGLARGSNWQLSNNDISRMPAPVVPYQNRRLFELPKLNGDDNYILSIMERIIQASLLNTDYSTSVLSTYNSFTLPDGWVGYVSHPAFTTYERVQFDFVDSTRRAFSLVGRKDTNWLWQRFVSDNFPSGPYDFTASYVETEQLPYEPNQAGRWVYGDDTFDFEFVEFTSGCYVSTEFYPMPAKPGDQFLFNISDANLTGIDSALIGLFEQDGTFVQQIGTAQRPSYCTCNYSWSNTYNSSQVDDLIFAINGNIVTPPQIYYNGFYLYYTGTLTYSLVEINPSEFLTDANDLINYLTGMSNNEFVVTGTTGEDGSVTITITLINPIICKAAPFLVSFQTGIIPTDPETGPFEIGLYDESKVDCCSVFNQLYGSVTIPSKQGCYRMGIYNEPSQSCDLTFIYTLVGEEYNDYINYINTNIYGVLQPYLSFGVNNDVYVFEITVNTIDEEDIKNWCEANIPGMSVTILANGIEFAWTVNDLPCGEYYSMSSCASDVSGETCFDQLWSTEDTYCECSTSYELYSLSNLINIDRAECFSTILEFWSDNNTIAEGYEYINDWKQRIRIGLNGGGEKPMIEESLYRQSNGVHRRPSNKQDLSIDLHTDFFDLETQLAMTDATRHPYFVWNGQSVFVKGDLEVATIQDFTNETSFETLAQMKFQVLKQGFQPKNSSCLNC